MRTFLFLAALAASAPAAAAPDVSAVQRQLDNPAMVDKLGRMTEALTSALLNLPVGELKAAVEGRAATPAERATTVRDLGRMDDPDFDRRLHGQIAGSRETMRAGMKAMSAALPAMMKGLQEAAREMEKATANLPSPTYPNR